MDPVEALERITYLLDRDLAPAVKANAFMRAAETVRADRPRRAADPARRGPAQGAARHRRQHRHGDRRGARRQDARYLQRLEETTSIPIGEGGEIRAALKGDCHTHSVWSDGGAPIEKMARAAQALGHDYMVLTDHSARLTVAHGLSAERLREQLDEVEQLNEKLAPFRILTGMEVDILEDGSLDMTDDLLGRLDVVVASVHSKLRMERSEMTRRMVLAMASPHIDILGHCTGRKVVGRGRPQSQFDPEIVFAACARFDKAVEINCRPERQDPPEELLRWRSTGAARSRSTPTPTRPGQLEWQPYGCDKAARLGIDAGEIVNTMDADDLIEWARITPGRVTSPLHVEEDREAEEQGASQEGEPRTQAQRRPRLAPTRFLARVSDHVDLIHGVEVADPYRWLEDGESDETKAWASYQNARTRAVLDALPTRPRLHARLTELLPGRDIVSAGDRGGPGLLARAVGPSRPGRAVRPSARRRRTARADRRARSHDRRGPTRRPPSTGSTRRATARSSPTASRRPVTSGRRCGCSTSNRRAPAGRDPAHPGRVGRLAAGRHRASRTRGTPTGGDYDRHVFWHRLGTRVGGRHRPVRRAAGPDGMARRVDLAGRTVRGRARRARLEPQRRPRDRRRQAVTAAR